MTSAEKLNPSALVLVDDEQLVNPLDPLKLTRTFSQDSQKADLRY